ncbi:PPOX class F420-dependent oxidoreductase [Georgenia yuyongxinii]|uniref:PPOX class F420-dependent oxidoreductase n=1 Tax=Georgenia yuyongxinii TaxID=2589797 RepID=A0A552WX35_9MICO|nr:PPOX class F420-dependent oxidoreductase [Georgenia yuyongxinii]TRW47391.1 PPOX class F420-dependent oxidoreductase [Georgenia yuyongxinii]
MPRPPLPADVAAMLARPNHATIATARADGHPVSVPTWYLYEDGRILVNMDAGRRRLAHLRADPRVSLSAMDPAAWTTHVSILGTVAEMRDDADLADIDRISRHYTGHPYPVRDKPRVSAWIRIERWHAWGALKNVR